MSVGTQNLVLFLMVEIFDCLHLKVSVKKAIQPKNIKFFPSMSESLVYLFYADEISVHFSHREPFLHRRF